MTFAFKNLGPRAIIFFAALLLGGCQRERLALDGAVFGPVWKVQTLNGKPFSARATLQFSENGQVSGKGPCNRYFGPMEITGSDITIGPVASTKMACLDLSDEQEYLTALESVTEHKVSSGQLMLGDTSGWALTFLKDN